MAAYNGAPYIGEQIDSILQQTDTNWHLTISDDGSTDGTDAIIDEYARQ
ncbi:MAG: glycosyltransferase, partial [Candidatus Ventricola sp.]|nr:glycosyltransferase [Candidatus Ventricola sp.]